MRTYSLTFIKNQLIYIGSEHYAGFVYMATYGDDVKRVGGQLEEVREANDKEEILRNRSSFR